MLVALILTLFPMLMIFAAFSDILTMTISNWVSIALVVGYGALALLASMSLSAVLWDVSCALTVLTITFVFFARGWIGGGDAKLASATALWTGWGQLDDYSILFALFGGVLTLVILYLRFAPVPPFVERLSWMGRLQDKANGVPYGVALAAAGMMVYPQTAVWIAASSV